MACTSPIISYSISGQHENKVREFHKTRLASHFAGVSFYSHAISLATVPYCTASLFLRTWHTPLFDLTHGFVSSMR